MKLLVILAVLPLMIPAPAHADKVTLYLDGAVIEKEHPTVRGVAEFRLPSDAIPASLRIVPVGTGEIVAVETEKSRGDRKTSEAITRLNERRDAIGDRFKALDVREEIFRTAAKSQSGKAPRKSKSNPEPLSAIRQGTDYALSQLETVFRARRKAQKELQGIEEELAVMKERGQFDTTLVRVRTQESTGSVRSFFQRNGLSWKPRYDFRLDGSNRASVTQFAVLPATVRNDNVSVVPTSFSLPQEIEPHQLAPQGNRKVSSWQLPVENPRHTRLPVSQLAFSVTNSSGTNLPAGIAACYWKGEYMGTFSFTGIKPGESVEIACGSLTK